MSIASGQPAVAPSRSARAARSVSQGLSREHVEPRRVQPRDGAELGLVPAREDHDGAAPLLDEGALRVDGLVHFEIPVRGVAVPGVERAHEGDERVAFRSGSRMEVNPPVHAGAAHPAG